MLYLTILDFVLLAGHITPDRFDDNVGECDTEYHPSRPSNEE